MDNSIIKYFKEGKLINYPKNQEDRKLIWEEMRSWFDKNKEYNEMQVNLVIKPRIEVLDHAFFRRELIDHGVLTRDPLTQIYKVI